MESTKFNITFQLLIHIFVVYVAAEERYLVNNIFKITNFSFQSQKGLLTLELALSICPFIKNCQDQLQSS